MKEKGPIIKRSFWNWDHSTEWALNKPGSQTFGANNQGYRRTEDFLEDFTSLLEWAGKNGIDWVVSWGLLRDCHGGVESAKKLCDIANKNGVCLLSGAGLNAYGGVYYEGNSEYSLENHLLKHPELIAVDKDGNKLIKDFGIYGRRLCYHACPSRKENQDYIANSLKWLLNTAPFDGVQIESGDTGLCMCKDCTGRRKHPGGAFSWDDMVLMYPIAEKAVHSVKKDAVIIAETYSQPEPQNDLKESDYCGCGKVSWADECLARFPKDIYLSWIGDDITSPVNWRKWTDAGFVKNGHHNIMRVAHSTYWKGIRGELATDYLAEVAGKSIKSGFDILSVFGEVSPLNTNAELNYLSIVNYGSADNPDAKEEAFIEQVAAPLLGGKKPAEDYFMYAKLSRTPAEIPKHLPKVQRNCGKFSTKVNRRWVFLAHYLSTFLRK